MYPKIKNIELKKLKKNKYGIVQGRLSKTPNNELQWFPQKSWKQEFVHASNININFIELLVEREFNKQNPFWTKKGRQEICEAHVENNLNIYSICNDYIINHSLINCEVQKEIINFIELTAKINCKKIILPLLEKSSLNMETFDNYVLIVKKISKVASEYNIKICIESLLTGSRVKDFIEKIDEENVKLVFDTGNRVLENPNLESEIMLLDNLIEHVHIKDKNIKSENVLLGTGLVNFEKIFLALNKINYKGPYVFETTRGINPIKTAEYHMSLCNFFIGNAETNE